MDIYKICRWLRLKGAIEQKQPTFYCLPEGTTTWNLGHCWTNMWMKLYFRSIILYIFPKKKNKQRFESNANKEHPLLVLWRICWKWHQLKGYNHNRLMSITQKQMIFRIKEQIKVLACSLEAIKINALGIVKASWWQLSL